MVRQLRPYLMIAQLTSPYGVRGGLRFQLLTNDPDLVPDRGTAYLADAKETILRPVSYMFHGKGKTRYLQLDTVEDRTGAEALRGFFLAMERQPLAEGRYYVCDLIGSKVLAAESGELLGTLRDILQATAQDVYVVARPGKKDLLFPLADNTLERVDIEQGEIHVRLPKGLLEIYE